MDPIQLIIQAINQTAPTLQAIAQQLGVVQQQAQETGQAVEGIGEQAEQAAGQATQPIEDLNEQFIELAQTLKITYQEAQALSEGVGLANDEIVKTVGTIRQLNALKIDGSQIFASLQKQGNITAEQFEKIRDTAIGKPKENSPPPVPKGADQEVVRLAKALQLTYGEAEKLAGEMGLTAKNVGQAVSTIRELSSVKVDSSKIFGTLEQDLGITAAQFERLQEVAKPKGDNEKGLGGFGAIVAGATKALGWFGLAVEGVKAALALASRQFDLFIGQNITLREQVQSTAAQLIGKQDVLSGGKVVSDTLQAIKLAQEPIKEQINQLRIDATKLSGVTSNDLVPSFQAMVNASGSLRLNLQQSRELTVGLTAQAITLGRSAEQAQNDIAQIANGTIDPTYNLLAKSIGLNNERLRQLAAEGKLYDYIQQKTEAGLKGQALIAQTWSGVTSNIEEYVQLIAQASGAPLLDALLSPLQKVEQFLHANLETFKAFGETVGTTIANVVETIEDKVYSVIDAVGSLVQSNAGKITGLFTQIQSTAQGVWSWLSNAVGDVVGTFIEQFSSLTGSVEETIKTYQDQFGPVLKQIFADAAPLIETIGNGLKNVLIVAIDLFADRLKFILGMMQTLAPVTKAALEIVDGTLKNINAAIEYARENFAQLIGFLSHIPGLNQLFSDPIKDSADALQSVSAAADQLNTQSLGLIDKINAAKQQGNNLSADQLKHNKELADLAHQQVSAIDQQIATLKNITPLNEQESKTYKDKLNALEQQKQAIEDNLNGLKTEADANDKNSSALEFQNKKLDDRGTIFDQLKAKANAFQQTLEHPLDLNQATEAAKNLLDVTKQQAEMGAISTAEAEKRLRGVASDSRLEVETRRNAAQAITQLRKAELDRQKADIDANISTIQAKIEAGKIDEVSGTKQVTDLKKKELDAQLANVQHEIAAEQEAIKKGYGDPNQLRALRDQQKEIQAQQLKAAVEGEEAIQKARLEVFKRAQDKALAEAKLAETERENQIQELQNKGQLRETEAGAVRLKAKRSELATELELEKRNLAELESLPALSDPAKEEERQQQIRASRQKTADLTHGLLENEYQQQEQARKLYSEQLDRRVQAVQNAGQAETLQLQDQERAIDAITKSLDLQNKLLDARKNLLDASTGLINTELDVLSKISKSAAEQKNIAKLKAAIEIDSLTQKQQLEAAATKLQQEQLRLSLEREKAENRIAQLKNQSDVAKGLAEVAKLKADRNATPEQIQAAQLAVIASVEEGKGLQQQASILNRQGLNQEQLFVLQDRAQQARFSSEQVSAQGNFIETLTGQQRSNAERELRGQLLNRLGVGDRRGLGLAANAIADSTSRAQFGVGGLTAEQQLQAQTVNLSGLRPRVDLNQPSVAQLRSDVQDKQNQADLFKQLQSAAKALTDVKLNVNQQNQIINQFTGQDVNNGQFKEKVGQQILDTQYSIAQELERRSR